MAAEAASAGVAGAAAWRLQRHNETVAAGSSRTNRITRSSGSGGGSSSSSSSSSSIRPFSGSRDHALPLAGTWKNRL